MKTQLKLFLRFLKVILPYRKRWSGILILSGLGTLFGLINPYLTKLVIDKGIGNKDLRVFIILVLLGGSVFILNGLVEGWKEFLDRYINTKVNFDLSRKVFKHIEGLSFSYFQNKSTGEHLYKIGYDIERVADFITTTPPQAVAIFPKLIFILAIVFYLNREMAVFSLILAPFLYLPTYYFTRRMRKVWQALIENSENIFKNLQETFSHIQLLKVFGKETQSIRHYLKMLITNIRIRMKNIKLEIFSRFASSAVSRIIIGLMTFYGGYQVIKGQMTLGSLTAIIVYLTQLMGMQSQFAYFFQTTALGLVSCQRVAEVLDEEAKVVVSKEAKEIGFQNGRILFREVSFGYNPSEAVLNKISFDIEGGSHIGLVGPSGCGKTTTVNLILRLFKPFSGEIMIDGYNINQIKSKSFYEQIGVVLQEPYLWNDTIENNIRYGRGKASLKEVQGAAKIACVDDFVNSLPEKYNTVIGENACKISEGQKQRIAIARVIIKRPKILILDEALSSVDVEIESKIIDNVRASLIGSTIIIISHRLSTMKTVDSIYFLKGPDKIIIGPYEELLRDNIQYL
jgi:ATP-binding cassette, subfamily B, bacterial